MVGREQKEALRRELLARREEMGAAARAEQSQRAVAALLARFPPEPGAVVATYASFGTEPATIDLNAALAAAGVRLLLPVMLPDRDLAWTDGRPGSTPQPPAITSCVLVVVPGLAADGRGRRLGRGGGSYDRALSRVAPGVPRVWLGYAHELVDELPAEAHDEPVTHAALPDGVHGLGG